MSGYHTRLSWCKQSHCLSPDINAHIKSWLFDSNSLTARLMRFCNGTFSVKIISIKRCTPTPDELFALGLKPRSQALIREVLLCCDDTPLVYARTIIPISSLRGALRGLVLLGNKPLGAVLFADKNMRRKAMEVTRLNIKHKCYSWTQYTGEENIWGRRSVFILKNKELLVSEFYLPNLLV